MGLACGDFKPSRAPASFCPRIKLASAA